MPMYLCLFLFFAYCTSVAQPTTITTFTYPTNAGQAFASDKYEVFVKAGNAPEVPLQVLMSDVNYKTMYDGDWMKNENKNRTFSFVHLDYDTTGPALQFRIVKKFGDPSNSVVISPKSYGYTPVMSTANEVVFTMNEHAKYISIKFEGADNETPTKKWIKNMLCLFVDPPESQKPDPTAPGVIQYSNSVNATALKNAQIIYFPAGYHNLRQYQHPGTSVTTDGKITLHNGQSIYLEGGAFVEGIIERSNYSDKNQKIFGRGIWTGRQYYWKNHPMHSGIEYGQLISIGDQAQVQGIMYMESPNHGIVGRKVHIENVKFLGWHSNHDGMRVGAGSEIAHSFSRAVDDHFYNFGIHVHHCVLWAGHNGAIMTYGWGGEAGSNNYGAGASLMEEIDIINPEWTGLGNNNGLIMSQQGYNHPTIDYGTGSATTILRNIRMEGTIPAITNLKPRSSSGGNIAVQVDNQEVTFLGDLILENISVEAQFTKGVIRGELNPSYNGNAVWYVKDVQFKNITIGGQCITQANKSDFFEQDAATTQNVQFTGCDAPPDTTPIEPNPIPNITDLNLFTHNCQEVALQWSDVSGEEAYRIRRKQPGDATYAILADVPANSTSFVDTNVQQQVEYMYMVRPMLNGVAVAISNTPIIQIPDCTPVSIGPPIMGHTASQKTHRFNALGQIEYGPTQSTPMQVFGPITPTSSKGDIQ
jgi:hypothetical protein